MSPQDLEAVRRELLTDINECENKIRAELLEAEKRIANRIQSLEARIDKPNAEIGDLQTRAARIEEFLRGRGGEI